MSKHQPWVKLFRQDPPTYDALPSRFRCLADRLLKFADGEGRISALDGRTPEQVVNSLLSCATHGADRKADVRFHNQATKRLLQSGHLYTQGGALMIQIQRYDKSARRVVTKQPEDTHGTLMGHSRAPNPTESLGGPSQDKIREDNS